jgi:hypothetical protein
VNEEKNAARELAIQNNTRGTKNAYKLARTKVRRLLRKNARQLDKEMLDHSNQSGYVSSQDRRTSNQKKPSTGEMERTF